MRNQQHSNNTNSIQRFDDENDGDKKIFIFKFVQNKSIHNTSTWHITAHNMDTKQHNFDKGVKIEKLVCPKFMETYSSLNQGEYHCVTKNNFDWCRSLITRIQVG